MQAYLEKVEDEVEFEIPVLRDAYGLTALHICLGIDRLSHEQREFFVQPPQFNTNS